MPHIDPFYKALCMSLSREFETCWPLWFEQVLFQRSFALSVERGAVVERGALECRSRGMSVAEASGKPAVAASTKAAAIAGNVVMAMAWRVKYRVMDAHGSVLQRFIPIMSLGPHMMNRGGVYPSGIRCKSLNVEVLTKGFAKEECNHTGVCVEERPAEEVTGRPHDYVSLRAFNKSKSYKDELLVTCFQTGWDDVRYGTLAHTHILLVLRAWLTRAKWGLEDDIETGLKFCDSEGKLSLSAVAGHPNCKEMLEVLRDGLLMEVLSWKMDEEEPTAASVISQALNEAQTIALRTTELTAVAVLQRLAITQMSKDVGQRVAFQTIKDLARNQLGVCVDEPDFIELYDFLISLGVGKNTFVEELLEFGMQFVDSKLRQLRYQAFAEANKVDARAPRVKVAMIKRAYRKKPSNGMCPSPEASWKDFHPSQLLTLEAMLHYFHVTCKPAYQQLAPQSRNRLMANIDVAACDAFITLKSDANGLPKTQKVLIEATTKYAHEIGPKLPPPDKTQSWITFPTAEAVAKAKAAPVVVEVAPRLLEFDESTGTLLNQQIEFDPVAKKGENAKGCYPLPWRDWLASNSHHSLGVTEVGIGSAVAAMHHLHATFDTDSQKIDLSSEGNVITVRVNCDVEAGSIVLPPCIPMQARLVLKTEHPNAVKIVVNEFLKPVATEPVDPDDASQSAGSAKKKGKIAKAPEPVPEFTGKLLRLWAHPEFKCPQDTRSPLQVEAMDSPEWKWTGSETMHPFWAVRRASTAAMAREQSKVTVGTSKPRINCELVDHTFTTILFGGTCSTLTRVITLPFLTNSMALTAGEELILEVAAKVESTHKPKRSWKEVQKTQEAERNEVGKKKHATAKSG
jgi:hypothetical protein